MSCADLLETRVKSNNACKIRKLFGNNWCQLNDFTHHPNGKIWMMWKNGEMNKKMVACSYQYIHCRVYIAHGRMTNSLTMIYAQN